MFFYLPDTLQLDAYQTYKDNDKLSVSFIIKEYLLAENISKRITVITPEKDKYEIESLYDLTAGVQYELEFHDDFPFAHFYMTRTAFNKMNFLFRCVPPSPSLCDMSDTQPSANTNTNTNSSSSSSPDKVECIAEGIEIQSLKGEKVVFHQKARMQFEENYVDANGSGDLRGSKSGGSANSSGLVSSGSGGGGSGNNINNNSSGDGSGKRVSTAVDLDYSYGFVDGTIYVSNFRCVFVPYKFVNTSKLVFQDMRYSGVVIGDTVLDSNYMGTCVYTQDDIRSAEATTAAEAAAADYVCNSSIDDAGWDNGARLEALLLKNRPVWFPLKAVSKLRKGSSSEGFLASVWNFVSFAQPDPDANKILRVVLSPYYRCTLYGTFFFIFESECHCAAAHKAFKRATGAAAPSQDSFPLSFGGFADDASYHCPIRDFDVREEFEREGLILSDDESGDDTDALSDSSDSSYGFANKWRLTDMNKNYEVTPTYQQML